MVFVEVVMTVSVERVESRASERYPWTHRVAFDGNTVAYDQVNRWVQQQDLPGVLMDLRQGAVFYTNKQAATFCALRWL